jgi:hypothetical protein
MKSVASKFPSECAVSLHEFQNVFSVPEVTHSVTYIGSNFGWLAVSMKHVGTQEIPLQISGDVTKNICAKRAARRGGWGNPVRRVAGGVRKKPEDLELTGVCQIVKGVYQWLSRI